MGISKTTQIALAALLLIFGVLAGWYASVTPYRTQGIVRGQTLPDIGAPDERQHANYIRDLRNERKFPVLDPKSPNLYERYQSHQPPLYYLLAAPFGDPTQPGGERLRWLNVLIGLAGVVGLFKLGQWATDREEVGLLAASFALMPGHLMLHGAITNDPLLMALCTWTVALCVLALRVPMTLKLGATLGGFAGLAMLTKSSGLALVPVLLITVVLLLRQKSEGDEEARKADRRRLVQAISVAVLAWGVLALPWLARNASLYGDPLGLRVFQEAFTGSAQAKMFIDELGAYAYWTDWVLWWTARSWIGVFGYMMIFMPDRLYLALLALFFVISCGALIRARNGEKLAPGAGLLATAFFVVVVALFVQFNRTYFQGQARYLYPAVSSMALLYGWAGTALAGKFARHAWIVSAIGLVLLNSYALTQVIPAWFQAISLMPNP